jgi:hypothetical protein
MTTQQISIEPDPQILQILTYLEMRPIDSLCELIDNSIDALEDVPKDYGSLVVIELPTKRDVDEVTARVRVRDNGPGMTLEQLEKSLRAGYSSKPRQGHLGLFGVGFNIATGKLGRVTRVVTARKDDEFAIETIIDLVSLRKSKEFKLLAQQIPKPDGLPNGTIVEVSQPWGAGNQNFGFMMKLVGLGRPKTLELLGRIYATILRNKKIRIVVGEDSVEPFSHCVWDDTRFVEHQKHGQIPAVYRFSNKVIHTYQKCAECGSVIPEREQACADPKCGSTSTVTQEERISGWVGIQRYLDASHFGVDLIRNGRLIRPLEKEPFFTFQDLETGGDPIVDYPTDNREGRIVGEIQFDHVPVDPAKQNFERSSPEWRRAIEFLRGKSSLQPERPGAESNASPIFKLYQGYRKVRMPGKRSMTMGKWLPGSNESTSLRKPEIEELLRKFKAKEPGYVDDSEWYRLVEQADEMPVEGLIKCPSCHIESPKGTEECPSCGHIFEGKECINKDCHETISLSRVTCQYCGSNQIPHIEQPWVCAACGNANTPSDGNCGICSHTRGALSPTSREGLSAQSHRDDALSFEGLTIKLASGESSSPISVRTYLTRSPIYSYHKDGSKHRLPSVRFIEGEVDLFIDPSHPFFEQAGVSRESQVAAEVASYLLSLHGAVAAKYPTEHSLTKLMHEILAKAWPDAFNTSGTEADLNSLFAAIRLRLLEAVKPESEDVYGNLSQEEKTALASDMVSKGRDMSEIAQLKQTGQFVHFLRPQAIVDIYRYNPKLFFDGNVWNTTYALIPSIDPTGGSKIQEQIREEHGSLMEIAAIYADKGAGSPREADLAKAACRLLLDRLGE